MHKFISFTLIFILISAPAWSEATPGKNAPSLTETPAPEDAEFESFDGAATEEIYDPYEKFNRKVYAFNDALDRYFFEYVAKAYRAGIPKPGRKLIRNFLVNLSLPLSTVNSLLQGNIDNSLATFSHFLINSTVGIFGLFDIAGDKGIRYRPEDFGQTLGRFGSGPGPYLVIPLLGPSSMRDFSGFAVDRAVDPLGFNVLQVGGNSELIDSDYRIGLTVLSKIDLRESLIETLDDIRKDSFDPYATIRSAYLQKRETDIKN